MIDFQLRAAEPRDVPAIVGLIGELAAFEHLSHLLRVTPETLAPHLFGERPVVEAVVADARIDGGHQVVAFALFFTSMRNKVRRLNCMTDCKLLFLKNILYKRDLSKDANLSRMHSR